MALRPRHIGVALIGQQFMGRAHSNAWNQVGKFFDLPLAPTLEVISARDGRSLAPFAERWGWNRWTTRWRDLAADPAVQLVDIGTPNDVHAEQAIAMLEAGKHVACEKPLAGTLRHARAMRDAAQASRARTFVWFNYRRCPAVGLAWQLMRERRLGRIHHVRARYLQSWGHADTPLTWRFQKKLAGSGAHGDLNAHSIDLARFLMGKEIESVDGAIAATAFPRRTIPGTKRKGRNDVDDSLAFLARFAGGAVATFEASRVATGHLNDNSVELIGELGSLRFDFEDMNALHYFDATLPKRTQGWRRIICTTSAVHPYVGNWWPEGHPIGYEHGFVNMAADILRVLGRKQPALPLPDFADGYETQRVLEAALVSAKEHTAIPLDQIR